MAQLELNYSASYLGHKAWRGAEDERVEGGLAALNAAIEYLTRKNVIFELNVNKTTLSEALNESNDKRVAAEWLFKVLAMLTMKGDERCVQLQREILSAIMVVAPRFSLADASDEPTAEEIAIFERVSAKLKRRAA